MAEVPDDAMVDEDELRAADGRVPGRRGLATRQKLLEHTQAMLRESSYRELKVIDIAREAGTSPATFYQYFPDVEEAILVLATEAAHDGEVLTQIATAGPWTGAAGYETAERLVAAFFEFWGSHSSVLRVVDLATAEGDDRFRQIRVRLLNEVATALAQVNRHFVTKGKAPGGLDPMAQAGVVVSMLAHVSDHQMGFEFWGIKTKDIQMSMARQVYWTITGQKPPRSVMHDLSGQVAVVTGGNGGIGLGFAEGVARCGADVAIWARNADKSAEAVDQLASHGVRAVAVACDVADEASVAAAVAETVSALGRIDICVANAGTSGFGTIEDMSFAEWRRLMDVNLDGVFLTFRDCAQQMREQGEGGAMVGVSSTSAVHGAPMNPHYAASKTAVLGLVRSAAVGLARHSIRVNAILPGWTKTELADPAFQNEQFREVTTKRTPARRWADGDEYHEVAAYLCDKSITFHTGDTVTFDGGYTVF